MELIKITENNGKQVVSARELHAFLENTDNVNTWFKRQSERAMLVENEDFVSVAFLQPSGQNAIDYAISINSAKEIAMLNGGEKGKQARTYFIECEKQLQLQAPRTLKEALLLAAKLEDEREQLQLQLSEQAPKIAAFERVIDGATTYTLDSVSDILNIGRTSLSKMLKSINWAMVDSSKGTSSTRYAELQGYAKTVFEYITIGGQEYKQKKIVLTKKGLDSLIVKLNETKL